MEDKSHGLLVWKAGGLSHREDCCFDQALLRDWGILVGWIFTSVLLFLSASSACRVGIEYSIVRGGNGTTQRWSTWLVCVRP